ncbi:MULTISPECIES: rhodanese-like domain-containing protein [unclassified Methanoculleus]|jgi:phage shock protein E|uniref:rhodanese-like domain-containing protein n=1 Tax=unclassified Methanoculleus TaxID=2619537 RepID=UPI0025CE5C57|nr:rhodanese-like domain-containing protein [Methanoculleus sp. UBA377]
MLDIRPSLAFLLLAGSTLAAVLIGGCLGGGPASGDRVSRTIPPGEASALIEERGGDPMFVVIDVRRPEEYAGGHIPGAINIDSAHFSERLESLDANGTYVLCCQRGGRSAGVRKLMGEAGFCEVYDIKGGLNAWKAAGLPVTKD